MDGPSLTIREAALATGLSQKAIRRRIERGTLQAQLHAGRTRIPADELFRRNLLVADPAQAAARREQSVARKRSGSAERDLLERLERQAERIGILTAELAAERERRSRLEARLARLEHRPVQ